MTQHVQDIAIFERRLRPIYDNLELGNNRKALQETDKLLKKHPNLLCARALKGLALLRLGRSEESHKLLHDVAFEKPIDDSTLQVLSFCYREMEQLDKIVDLYSNAVKQTPGNEELLAHLFISHVRLEDFKSQQAVALQLYRVQPKNGYYFWAVISVVLQATRGPDACNSDKRKIYLALAQRMVDKLIKGDKMENEQEAHLYIQILKLQNKYEEALQFLDSSICQKVYPGAPVSMRIEFLIEVKCWEKVNDLLKTLLQDDRDRWDYYQDYLKSCFELINPQETQQSHQGILDSCYDFLCQLIESHGKKVRGPYLARLELHKRMRERQMDAQNLLGDFSTMIIEYFHLFGDKSCCTHDITLFLPSLTMQERQDLASNLLLECGISFTTLPQNKEQMQKHICALQISRICGSHIDLETEHLLAFYTALKLHYEHGLSSFGKNLLPTDMGPSDAYALLAANVMYDITLKTQKSDHLFEALCLLQYVIRNSTSNFHVKLLSLKIYHLFGCLMGAQEMYDSLDIKQIQLDSMGYVHCNLLPLCGRFSMARTLFDSTLKFFTNSYKERFEYIASTYRFCTFSKLEEFMNFKDRLTNSIHYVSTSVEAQLCDLVTMFGSVSQNLSTYSEMCINPADDRISWNELKDNRDLEAIVRWDPVHLVDIEKDKKESFNQECDVLQIRSLLLRLIASYVDLYHKSTKIKTDANMKTAANHNNVEINNTSNTVTTMKAKDTDTIDLLRDSWTCLFQRLRQNTPEPLSNRFLVNLLPTRLHLLLEIPYEKFFNDLSQLVIDLYVGSNNLPTQCKQVSDNVIEICEIMSDVIKKFEDKNIDALLHRKECQNKVAACLEILSLFGFVLTVFNDKLQTSGKTKSRKKSENIEQNHIISEKERSQLIGELIRHLKKKLQCCESILQFWKAPILPRDLNTFMADMSLKPEVEATLISDVAVIFRESHELMVTEMKNVIKDKIRMVST